MKTKSIVTRQYREYFKPFGGKISQKIHTHPTRKKKWKHSRPMIGWSFMKYQWGWLKGATWPSLVWHSNETDYSCCVLVPQNTPYWPWTLTNCFWLIKIAEVLVMSEYAAWCFVFQPRQTINDQRKKVCFSISYIFISHCMLFRPFNLDSASITYTVTGEWGGWG